MSIQKLSKRVYDTVKAERIQGSQVVFVFCCYVETSMMNLDKGCFLFVGSFVQMDLPVGRMKRFDEVAMPKVLNSWEPKWLPGCSPLP